MNPILWLLLKALILATVVLTAAAAYLLAFRKVLGYFQMRLGPNRVGPWGTLQPVADVFKMMLKEPLIPKDADNIVFRLAPIIAFFSALGVYVVIPWGPNDGFTMSDPNAGLLVFLAIAALSVYGVALGGWASQSKYSLLGAMRATAQMISYELAMAMSLIGVVLMANSLRISDIVAAQANVYNIFPQFLGFVVFFLAGLAEASHPPFDLPEAESELVAGYHTEYSGMRFGMYFLTDLVHTITLACLTVLLYLGGWNTISFLSFIPPTLAYILKVIFMVFVLLWIRATTPRLRYDKLMSLGWKWMMPLAALNLVGTAVYVALWAPV